MKTLSASRHPCSDAISAEARRATDSLSVLALLLVTAACAPQTNGSWESDVTFETTTIVIETDEAEIPLEVEVARTESERRVGLSGRSSLAPDAGMIFLFDSVQGADRGFWMWRTRIPLDIAYIGEGGAIRVILRMEPCESMYAEGCPVYEPGVEYASALEMNAGWFEARGVAVGDRVRMGGEGGEG